MKDGLGTVILGVASISLAIAAQAAEYKFVPNDGSGNPADIWDLDHYRYFTWGISDWSVPTDEKIIDAVLTIHDVNNWTATENGSPGNEKNWLHIHLLDSANNPARTGTEQAAGPTGKLVAYTDNQLNGDNLLGWTYSDHVKIATYSDYNGGPRGNVVTLTYSLADLGFLDEFTAYLSNGNNFGFGFDPDCHYYNNGVDFVVRTGKVPDGGSTLALLGGALLGLAGCATSRRSANS